MSLPVAGGLAYREALPEGEPQGTALFLHGFPESSHMWTHGALEAARSAGWRAVAPDLAGFGDSEPDPPGTWERHVASIERFRSELGLDRLALVVHDWGGLIGLWWACEHPDAIRGLLISDTGFFADGEWHGLATMLRTEGQGEQLVEAMNRETFGATLSQVSPGMGEADLDEYFRLFADETRRRGVLELYRSGDFEKLARFDGALAAMGVPTQLLWGGKDEFAPVASAHRFKEDIPHAELHVVEDAGHFVWDDAPEEAARVVRDFLGRL